MQPDLTVSEIIAALSALRAEVGPKCYATVGISARDTGVSGCCYPNDLMNGEQFYVTGATFREVIEKLNAGWAERSATYHRETVKKMALAIISITQDIGECSDAALRGSGFDAKDVQRFGVEACDLANEMAGRGPFSILIHAANANEAA